MASAPTTALSMKLLADTRARRVLFAEASKDVVDFLFSLLSLPIGTFVKIIEEDSSIVGCIGCLYESSEKLKGTYVQLGDALLPFDAEDVFTKARRSSKEHRFTSATPSFTPLRSHRRAAPSIRCSRHFTDATSRKRG
ncbi:unnamed protein product [Alopecurus aequalis]